MNEFVDDSAVDEVLRPTERQMKHQRHGRESEQSIAESVSP